LKPREKALRTFDLSEHRCLRQNQKFRAMSRVNRTGAYEHHYHDMRGFIQYVIGCDPDYDKIVGLCDLGPGANIGVHGNATNYARKLHARRWSVTPSLHAFSSRIFLANFHHSEFLLKDEGRTMICFDPLLLRERFMQRVDIVEHNKISFVPKTARTFRSIAVEPVINSYFQKGIDTFMRRCLTRVGIDLSDQGINVELARIGSENHLALDPYVTIDLSSASDSISIGLVKHLLPPEWYLMLSRARSPSYKLNGVVKTYHKFCSMGNGFCFPLQTLLFTAACISCGAKEPGRDFHVYGDDIIVRQSVAGPLLRLLRDMGFRQNPDKTFLEGPFRESCGRDWFAGMDVRPFILDFSLDSLTELFKAYNLTQRNERTFAFFREFRKEIFEMIPEHLRLVRPFPGNADTAMTVEFDQFLPSPYAKLLPSLNCWSWKELSIRPVNDNHWRGERASDTLLLIAALRGSSPYAPYTLRRKTRTSMRRVAHAGSQSTWKPGDGVRFSDFVSDNYTVKTV